MLTHRHECYIVVTKGRRCTRMTREKMETSIHIRLSPELKAEFLRIAEENSHNVSSLLRKWVAKYIEEQKGE